MLDIEDFNTRLVLFDEDGGVVQLFGTCKDKEEKNEKIKASFEKMVTRTSTIMKAYPELKEKQDMGTSILFRTGIRAFEELLTIVTRSESRFEVVLNQALKKQAMEMGADFQKLVESLGAMERLQAFTSNVTTK